MHSTIKTVVFWGVIVFSAFLLWQTVAAKPSARSVPEISYSEFLTQVESGSVIKVTISRAAWSLPASNQASFLSIAMSAIIRVRPLASTPAP